MTLGCEQWEGWLRYRKPCEKLGPCWGPHVGELCGCDSGWNDGRREAGVTYMTTIASALTDSVVSSLADDSREQHLVWINVYTFGRSILCHKLGVRAAQQPNGS
jgi:hypothetical protein